MFAAVAQYAFSFHLIAAMLICCRYIYLDTDPANDWRLRETAQKHGVAIVDIIQGHVDGVSRLVSSTCTLLLSILFDN